ncbi:MAG: cyclic nucleotide-binding domain-containing protein [Verrucomicrobia bacterium]|nr:cyclic nucleotide-binding domain-containing protein [Verrucomicrobiota bacterium]
MVSLECCRLFGALSPGELQQLREAAREIRVPAGREIFCEGDAGDGLYVVQSGGVLISAVVGDKERHEFSKIPPGETFGEMAVVDNQPRSACAVAETDSVLYFIPREPLLAVLNRSPQFGLALLQEVTHRLREFNRQYLRKVIHVERMALVGRFASSIVHDLKNPLTIIGIAADLSSLDSATPDSRKTAQKRIRRQVERINAMVSDILEFTRGPGKPLELAATDYAEFLRSVVQEIEHEVTLKGVSIVCQNEPPAVKLLLNPQRLMRVFYNLMFNAVDAMPEGGTIKLRFEVTAQEVITEIEDTGSGLAPEVLNRLFEAFTTYGKPRGTGLGLSITKRIVEEHGGRIDARNVPGGGALFRFALPVPKTVVPG